MPVAAFTVEPLQYTMGRDRCFKRIKHSEPSRPAVNTKLRPNVRAVSCSYSLSATLRCSRTFNGYVHKHPAAFSAPTWSIRTLHTSTLSLRRPPHHALNHTLSRAGSRAAAKRVLCSEALDVMRSAVAAPATSLTVPAEASRADAHGLQFFLSLCLLLPKFCRLGRLHLSL